MKQNSHKAQLRRDLHRLLRSMDFVSRHPSLKRDTTESRRWEEIYQLLGLAWEFLALQCRHRDGWRKVRDGKSACKVCGLIRGAKEEWLLLPREGKKTIGRRSMPNSKRTFPNRKAATVVNDPIEFHGAKLNVEVLNLHRSRLFRSMNISCAAERLVRLEEGGVEARFGGSLLTVELRKHQRGEVPPYSHFVSELPRKLLKNFPVMLQFDNRRRFTGLVIFKPNPEKARRRSKQIHAEPGMCLAECARPGRSRFERGRDLVKFPRIRSGNVCAAEDGSTPCAKHLTNQCSALSVQGGPLG